MKGILEKGASRCRVCHSARVERWELVCDECFRRHLRQEEEEWLAEREEVSEREEHILEEARKKRGGGCIC